MVKIFQRKGCIQGHPGRKGLFVDVETGVVVGMDDPLFRIPGAEKEEGPRDLLKIVRYVLRSHEGFDIEYLFLTQDVLRDLSYMVRHSNIVDGQGEPFHQVELIRSPHPPDNPIQDLPHSLRKIFSPFRCQAADRSPEGRRIRDDVVGLFARLHFTDADHGAFNGIHLPAHHGLEGGNGLGRDHDGIDGQVGQPPMPSLSGRN